MSALSINSFNIQQLSLSKTQKTLTIIIVVAIAVIICASQNVLGSYHTISYVIGGGAILCSLIGIVYASNKIKGSTLILSADYMASEYVVVEDIFVPNTDQTDKQSTFIATSILPTMKQKQKFLDIGAGPGEIAKKMKKEFNIVSVVEPIGKFEEVFQKEEFTRYTSYFQDANIKELQDLVLCSHVLYHVPRAIWKTFLSKMHSILAPNGKSIVVLISPTGPWADLHQSLHPNYAHSGVAKQMLTEMNIDHSVSSQECVFQHKDRESFKRLVSFFTIVNCFSPEEFQELSESRRKEINVSIDNFVDSLRQDDGTYKLCWTDSYIVMNKNK